MVSAQPQRLCYSPSSQEMSQMQEKPPWSAQYGVDDFEITRDELDKRLLARTDYVNHQQAFNVAKAVARFSMGLSKKDETGKLVDRFVERVQENSSNGFFDDEPEESGYEVVPRR